MENLATAAIATDDRVQRVVESVIGKGPAFIVEIVVRGRTGSTVVEVFLDSDEGLGLDELARFSREIGFLLEAEEIIKGKYRLNVSSPGADRPLRLARQLTKHVGRTLSVTMGEGEEVRGVLKQADADTIVLDKKDGEVTLVFDSIQEAKVVLPW